HCLQPIDTDRLLVADLLLEADVDVVAALDHLLRRLGEPRLVAIDRRNIEETGQIGRQADDNEKCRGAQMGCRQKIEQRAEPRNRHPLAFFDRGHVPASETTIEKTGCGEKPSALRRIRLGAASGERPRSRSTMRGAGRVQPAKNVEVMTRRRRGSRRAGIAIHSDWSRLRLVLEKWIEAGRARACTLSGGGEGS